jgi:transcription termination factor NusA
VRLASQLTGLDIDILTEEEESKRRQAEFEERTKLFMDTLDLDEFFAQLLVSEGFTSLEEVAYVEMDELLVIDGVDEGTAKELQARARDYLEEQNKLALEKARDLGVEDSLIEFEGLTPQMLVALGEDGVKTLEDFATCADWELAGGWTTVDGERVKDDGLLEPFDVSLEEAQNMVMTARVMLGWVDHRGTRGASRRRGGGRRGRSRRGRGRGLRPLVRAGHRDDAGRPEKGSGRRARTALHRHGRTAPKRGLVRFVVSPDGEIAPDILEKLPGRGIWVSADRTRSRRR